MTINRPQNNRRAQGARENDEKRHQEFSSPDPSPPFRSTRQKNVRKRQKRQNRGEIQRRQYRAILHRLPKTSLADKAFSGGGGNVTDLAVLAAGTVKSRSRDISRDRRRPVRETLENSARTAHPCQFRPFLFSLELTLQPQRHTRPLCRAPLGHP